MKTLTLIQPWATLIMIGAKKIETRSWSTKYRGPIAIHAGKKIDNDFFINPSFSEIIKQYNLDEKSIPQGCILGTCTIKDVIKSEYLINNISEDELLLGNYNKGRFGWVLNDICPFDTPIPAKGKLGLWEFR